MASSLKHLRLRKLLDYDPATGRFTWRVNGRGRYLRKGSRAGTVRKDGYRQICIDQKIYLSSRLAWLWMTGQWPRRLVDHENGKPSDDRWRNLREADYSQNSGNARRQQRKKPKLVPLKGVTFDPPKGTQRSVRPYQAMIKINYRGIYLGRFKTPREAHAAYLVAAKKYFGQYARAG